MDTAPWSERNVNAKLTPEGKGGGTPQAWRRIAGAIVRIPRHAACGMFAFVGVPQARRPSEMKALDQSRGGQIAQLRIDRVPLLLKQGPPVRRQVRLTELFVQGVSLL